MKKWLIFVITCMICLTQVKCQIQFRNPGFEGGIQGDFYIPPEWTFCDDHISTIYPDSPLYIPAPRTIIEGRSYVVMEKQKTTHSDGTVGQSLNCELKSYKKMTFSCFTTSFTCNTLSCDYQKGYLKVHLGYDSCDRRQLIYKSPLLDTVWSLQNITFSPDSDYSWVIFSAEYIDSVKFVHIALDALSPIYLINANAVHVANRDTVIYKRGSEQPCVPLHATSSIATFDTVRWYKLVNDTLKVPVANGFSTTQCLDSSTTFLIGMRDSVIVCAGVEWSWDTVRVWVRDTVLGINEGLQTQDESFKLFPNPVTDVLAIQPAFDSFYEWAITDELGRICVSGAARKERQLDISMFGHGVYLVRVNHEVKRFVKR